MKKLLAILSAVGLTAMASTTVVACQVHNDFSVWTANEILAQVLIDGKHSPLDIEKAIDGDNTLKDLIENGDVKTELIDKLLKMVDKKNDDIANGLKISIGMDEDEIKNLPKLITDWAENGGVTLRYIENGELWDTEYQGSAKTLNDILEINYRHKNNVDSDKPLPKDWNTLDENGVPHYGLALFFDLNKPIHSDDENDTLQKAGNNQTGKVSAANYWTFKLTSMNGGTNYGN